MGRHIFMDFIRWLGLDDLFKHAPNGDINVGDAATKTVAAIDQVFLFWNTGWGTTIEALISNEGVTSIEQVKTEILAIRDKLVTVQTLLDVSEALKDYRFADDDKRNDFYHSFITQVALLFNDGEISIAEALILVTTVVAFFKGQ